METSTGPMESLEDPKNYRLFINPDKGNPLFKSYKKVQEHFWVEEEIESELKKDTIQWPDIKPEIQKLVIHQIAFFLIGDGRVNQTISEHIDSRITDREVLLWYNYQKMMEDIHNIVYVKLADTYVTSKKERERIFNSDKTFPVIKKKIAWLKKWLGEGNDLHHLEIDTVQALRDLKQSYLKSRKSCAELLGVDKPPEIPNKIKKLFDKLEISKPFLAQQILINVIMEGLFFQGSFCVIFWVNHQYGKLPGLTKANEFISRDEGTHTDYGIVLYTTKIKNKLTQAMVHQIMREAVEIEMESAVEALPSGLLNMNSELMGSYIQYIADKLLSDLGYEKIYRTDNPFDFMKKQSISNRITDFFIDPSVSEYGHPSSGTNNGDSDVCFDEDF